MKKDYLKIAASLGIAVPACLLASSIHAEATTGTVKSAGVETKLFSNPVKDRMIQFYNAEEQTPIMEIAYTNTHANVSAKHTNQHSDYPHTNQHTDRDNNYCPSHTNSHTDYLPQSSHTDYTSPHTDQHVNRDDC